MNFNYTLKSKLSINLKMKIMKRSNFKREWCLKYAWIKSWKKNHTLIKLTSSVLTITTRISKSFWKMNCNSNREAIQAHIIVHLHHFHQAKFNQITIQINPTEFPHQTIPKLIKMKSKISLKLKMHRKYFKK